MAKAGLVVVIEVGELRNDDSALRKFGPTIWQSVNRQTYQLVLSIGSWVGAQNACEIMKFGWLEKSKPDKHQC